MSLPTSSCQHVIQLSVIIPAHNESDCIEPVVNEWLDYLQNQKSFTSYELIVVDNASTDGTGEIAKSAGAAVIGEPKMGYGQACWSGVKASVGQWLLFVDADGAANPNDMPALIKPININADLVVGVRNHPQPRAMSTPQIFGNALATFLIKAFWGLPVTDLGPLRLIRRSTFDALNMQDRSFGWTVEMQVKAYQFGARVSEVPVDWRSRQAGKSKISGTIRGVIGAGVGIVGMIFRLKISLSQSVNSSLSKKSPNQLNP